MKARATACPHCGQPLTAERFGVVLRPIWVRIVDAIVRAGQDGIARVDLVELIYADETVTPNVISVHVNHINAALAATDYRIAGGQGQTYRIVRQAAPRAVA